MPDVGSHREPIRMTYKGRSLDDLPLAAYTTGVDPDLTEEPAAPDSPQLSQQDAIALALGLQAATPPAEEQKPARRRPGLPRPRLPKFGRGGAKAEAVPAATLPTAEWPRSQPTAPIAAPAMASPVFTGSAMAPPVATVGAAPGGWAAAPPVPGAALPRVGAAMPMTAARRMAAAAGGSTGAAPSTLPPPPTFTPTSIPAAGVVGGPVRGGRARRAIRLDLGGVVRTLRNPRTAVRDPRVLLGAVGVLAVAVLAWGFLGGGGPSAGGPDGAGSSPTPGPVIAAPGVASVTLAGSLSGSYSLTGSSGSGRPSDGQLNAVWTDASGSSFTLTGRAGKGTRTTGDDLVLTFSVTVDGKAVIFSSSNKECTVGMATKPNSVSGSFVCSELTSADGKRTVKATGTYQT
jgi:hypothetical protein